VGIIAWSKAHQIRPSSQEGMEVAMTNERLLDSIYATTKQRWHSSNHSQMEREENRMNRKLVNIHKINGARPDYDVYIGRQNPWQGFSNSIFSNPFKIGVDGNREEVIRCYRRWLEGKQFHGFRQDKRVAILRELPTLRGKVLGCWCFPDPCHGDVLVALLEKGNRYIKSLYKKSLND
jgi:hypothetical protein